MNTVDKGKRGENIAAAFLESSGYKVVKRNFRAYGGEIDIVAVKEKTTVFAEVKCWSKFDFGQIERVLDRRKRSRIVRASKGFLLQYPVFSNNSIRYDLLYLSDSGKDPEHVMNAFTETDCS
ncbi:MAG: YraN family protein [Spirochaetales bacterium]|nr:YraN family protein [Spirochaetales bacterium]